MKTLIVFCISVAFASAQGGGAVVGAGYHLLGPVSVAPGQVITVFVTGIGNVTQKYSAGNPPLPPTLGGISAALTENEQVGIAAPILAVFPFSACKNVMQQPCGTITAVTLQIPFELQPNIPGSLRPPLLAFLTLSDQLGHSASMELNPVLDQIHLMDFLDTILAGDMSQAVSGGGVVTHADGSVVSVSKPARLGEELVMYAVGLGTTNRLVKTGAASPAPPAPAAGTFVLNFDYRPNAQPSPPIPSPFFSPASPAFVGLTPGFAGLYQINFVVPATPAPAVSCGGGTGPSNLTVTVAGATSFDGAAICVE